MFEQMGKQVSETMDMLGLKSSQATALLRRHRSLLCEIYRAICFADGPDPAL